MQLNGQRVEGKYNPIGLGTATPRFSWECVSPTRGDHQTAYQIQCGTTVGGSDLWDSGKVTSAAQSQVIYAGTTLVSRAYVYWRVRVWDASNTPTAYVSGTFGVGLLLAADWGSTVYVGYMTGTNAAVSMPPPVLRKDFTPTGGKTILRATLYATALGIYQAWLNGQRASQDEMAPGWTNYPARRQYQAYDVTGLVTAGTNSLALLVGDGVFCGKMSNFGRQWYNNASYGGAIAGRPYGAAILYIDYTDGTNSTVATNSTWVATTAGTLYSDPQNGEGFDANIDFPFSSPAVSTTGWASVDTIAFTPSVVSAQRNDPVRVQSIRPFRSATALADASYILDFGQNRSGYLQLNLAGMPRGAQLTFTHGEDLTTTGDLYTTNLQTATQKDTYICSGQAREVWRPSFTDHGFRYAKLTGWPLPRPPLAPEISQVAIHGDVPRVGTFTCSDPQISRVYQMSVVAILSNLKSVITDSCQRDERLGWMGDLGNIMPALMYLFDARNFLAKVAIDLNDAAGGNSYPVICPPVAASSSVAGWSSQGVLTPFWAWLIYGDVGLINACWSGLGGFLAGTGDGDVYDDYPGDPSITGLPAFDPAVFTAAWNIHAFDALARMATATGRTANATTATSYVTTHRATLNGYIQGDGTITSNSGSIPANECSQVLPLVFGHVASGSISLVASKLHSLVQSYPNGFNSGAINVAHMLSVLAATGYMADAYAIMTNTAGDANSFNASLVDDLTSLGESFNPRTRARVNNSHRSFNHHWRAGACRWIVEDVAGIAVDPSVPGSSALIMKPKLGGSLTFVDCTWRGPLGMVESHWRWGGSTGTAFTWTIVVPPGTTATVSIPTANASAVTESGVLLASASGVTVNAPTTGYANVTVGSGSYYFVSGT